MLAKEADNRISAMDALNHPWFHINGINLHSLNFDFSEFEDPPLTDE